VKRRLDLVLITRRPGLSRRRARAAIEKGQVTLSGVVVREPGRLVPEDVDLTFDPSRPALARARLELPRLFEDEHILIVDKPAGLLSVPTPGGQEDSVVGRVRAYATRLRRGAFARAVHRLDRETSGALALALTRDAAAGLIAQFRDHRIERRYRCVVLGRPGADAGIVDAPIRERYAGGRRGIARPGEAARPAVSRWRVIERLRGAALLEVELYTGRQHQIRAHLAHVGLPILGDAVYGPAGSPARANRILLHAAVLGFAHPVTGEAVRFESPLPADFVRAMRALRRR
jgi:23S rRNA pseudouridine1911/1915/1917 synthase